MAYHNPLNVKPHPAETPLFFVALIASIGFAILLVLSMIGAIYALFFIIFFFLVQVVFITHIRGSTIRLGEKQLPDVYARVATLSKKIGLDKTPDVYLMESSGSLNAFATRFFGTNFVVLYSDLIAACGDNTDAVDFIIGHELGHLHRRHLQKSPWISLGLFLPFLGQAYSRAREYTCDRYGFAACENKAKGVEGLGILAAGPKFADKIDKKVFTDQCSDVSSFWMTLGQWLSSYPPLVKRMAVLSPTFAPKAKGNQAMNVAVILVLITSIALPCFAVYKFGTHIMGLLTPKDDTAEYGGDYPPYEHVDEGFYPAQPVPDMPTPNVTHPTAPEPTIPQQGAAQ